MKKRILITGATGLVGSRIVELLSNSFEFIPLLHSEVDITKNDQLSQFIEKHDYDMCLHAAAYTHVDQAEHEPDLAYKLNVEATQIIYDYIKQQNKPFIHISTDFVFDGKDPEALYDESAKPNPISVYGKTKYESEQVVDITRDTIIRISYPFRSHFDKKKDFVRAILSALQSKKTLTMISDSGMVPTFIDDIALVIKNSIDNGNKGIIHAVGKTILSPFDAALMIATQFNCEKSLIQSTSYSNFFKDRAKRPQYSNILSTRGEIYDGNTFDNNLEKISLSFLNR